MLENDWKDFIIKEIRKNALILVKPEIEEDNMKDLNQLYQRLLKLDYKDMYTIEAEFCIALYYDFSQKGLSWITTFLTIASWSGTAMRSFG